MFLKCRSLIDKHPHLSLGVGGLLLAISPLGVFHNLKFIDEHILSINPQLHRYHGIFLVIARLAGILGIVATFVGALMIAFSILNFRRKLLLGRNQHRPGRGRSM